MRRDEIENWNRAVREGRVGWDVRVEWDCDGPIYREYFDIIQERFWTRGKAFVDWVVRWLIYGRLKGWRK